MGNGRKSGLLDKDYKYDKKTPTSTATNTTNTAEPIDWSQYRKVSVLDMGRMRTELGQDGINDSIYVGTSDSFNISANLRQRVGQQASGWSHFSNAEVDKLAAKIDSWMRPAKENFQTIRSVGSDWLKDNFGTTDKQNIASLINANTHVFHDAGFVSMSFDVNRNIFTGRGTILHLAVNKGTPVYVTQNRWESEVVGHRNMDIEFTRAEVKDGHLHIYGRIRK